MKLKSMKKALAIVLATATCFSLSSAIVFADDEEVNEVVADEDAIDLAEVSIENCALEDDHEHSFVSYDELIEGCEYRRTYFCEICGKQEVEEGLPTYTRRCTPLENPDHFVLFEHKNTGTDCLWHFGKYYVRDAHYYAVVDYVTIHTPGEAVVEEEIPETMYAEGSYQNVCYCTVCGEEASRETVIVPADTTVIDGVYIPQNDDKLIRAGAIIKAPGRNVTYTCTVIDYDYANYGTSKYPAYKETKDASDNWMTFQPKHPGVYGFMWRAIDSEGNVISEAGASRQFGGNVVRSVKIYIPDKNANPLRFGAVYDADDARNVRLTWYLYNVDTQKFEAVLQDGLAKEGAEWLTWDKINTGHYWILVRATATNNPSSTCDWGVDIKDGVVR